MYKWNTLLTSGHFQVQGLLRGAPPELGLAAWALLSRPLWGLVRQMSSWAGGPPLERSGEVGHDFISWR